MFNNNWLASLNHWDRLYVMAIYKLPNNDQSRDNFDSVSKYIFNCTWSIVHEELLGRIITMIREGHTEESLDNAWKYVGLKSHLAWWYETVSHPTIMNGVAFYDPEKYNKGDLAQVDFTFYLEIKSRPIMTFPWEK